MPLSVPAQIQALLFARVGTITTHTAARISWPGKKFTPPSDQNYLEVRYFPNTTTRQFIGSDEPHQRLGLLQLNVHGKKDQNEIILRELAGQVAAHFPCDLRLGTDPSVRITSEPNVTDLMVGDHRMTIPVMCAFEAQG